MTSVAEIAKEHQYIDTESVTETIETEEDEESFFQDIYLLGEHGVNISDIEKLRKSGINTIKGLQMTTCSNLLKLDGFDRNKIKQIQEVSCKLAVNNRFMTALEVSEERKQIFKITTGSANLDKLLGGGVESMALTQVFGESGTGKTQIAHTLCVTAQMPVDGYTGGKVMFIDTEHTFYIIEGDRPVQVRGNSRHGAKIGLIPVDLLGISRPERIRQVARRFSLDEKNVLENVLYARAYNSEHQYELLKTVGAKFHEEVGVFKLLIVDSIMALFRVDFLGMSNLLHRQQKVAEMMSLLKKMSEEYNIAVFLTNQITSDMKFSLLKLDDDGKPVGGNILAHASTTRIALKKVAGNVRIAKLYDSPELEEREEAFIITTGGVCDPKLPE